MTRHTHIVLIAVIAFVFTALASCSKDPEPLIQAPPFVPVDTVRPNPGQNPGGGNTGGINDSSGVTIVRGIDGATFFYHNLNAPTACVSSDDYGMALNLQHADTGKVRTKLVNSHKGTIAITGDTASNGVRHYRVAFSNINGEYLSTVDISNPDTAGKLQIWIYRTDGKDIIPAKNGQTAVNKFIHLIGTFPANVIGEGTIGLKEFIFPQSRITPAYMDSVFANGQWTIYKFNRRP